jgi:hypothetical protein
MGETQHKCVVCGEGLVFALPEGLAESQVVAAQCLTCLDQQFGNGSELTFRLGEQPAGAIGIGRVTISRAAMAALAKSGLNAVELLERHASLREEVRVVSLVQTSAGKLWVCTDIRDGQPMTVMLSATESRAVLAGLPKSA